MFEPEDAAHVMHESEDERVYVVLPAASRELPFHGTEQDRRERERAAVRPSSSLVRIPMSGIAAVFLCQANVTSNYMNISEPLALGNLITVTALPPVLLIEFIFTTHAVTPCQL